MSSKLQLRSVSTILCWICPSSRRAVISSFTPPAEQITSPNGRIRPQSGGRNGSPCISSRLNSRTIPASQLFGGRCSLCAFEAPKVHHHCLLYHPPPTALRHTHHQDTPHFQHHLIVPCCLTITRPSHAYQRLIGCLALR